MSIAIDILNNLKKSLNHLAHVNKHSLDEHQSVSASVTPLLYRSIAESSAQHDSLIAKRKNELMLRLLSAQDTANAKSRPVICGEISAASAESLTRVNKPSEFIIACKRSAAKFPPHTRSSKSSMYYD